MKAAISKRDGGAWGGGEEEGMGGHDERLAAVFRTIVKAAVPLQL